MRLFLLLLRKIFLYFYYTPASFEAGVSFVVGFEKLLWRHGEIKGVNREVSSVKRNLVFFESSLLARPTCASSFPRFGAAFPSCTILM